MKLICFQAQAAAVERMLLPVVASISELARAADLKEFEGLAEPGDALVIATSDSANPAPTSEALVIARRIGMAVWSLSDHWISKAAPAPVEPSSES